MKPPRAHQQIGTTASVGKQAHNPSSLTPGFLENCLVAATLRNAGEKIEGDNSFFEDQKRA